MPKTSVGWGLGSYKKSFMWTDVDSYPLVISDSQLEITMFIHFQVR